MVGGDSTVSNTGIKGGSITHLENMLGHKCQWNICAIHTNELPIRHLITKLDGATTSGTGFTEDVCKLLNRVEDLESEPNFEPIGTNGEPLIELPDEVVRNMSTDSQVCYRLCKAVRAGHLPDDLKDIQLGGINHARWLTTQGRILILCSKKHGLTGNNLEVLRMLGNYAVESYFKLYYDIKVKNSLEEAPYQILTQLRILKKQPAVVQNAVTKYIRTGAWYALSENILLSLIASSDKLDRAFAVDKILNIRGTKNFGDSRTKPRVTPKINLDASNLVELIPCDTEPVHEPIFTCNMSSENIKNFVEEPFKVPFFSIHTQSIEQAVKQEWIQ